MFALIANHVFVCLNSITTPATSFIHKFDISIIYFSQAKLIKLLLSMYGNYVLFLFTDGNSLPHKCLI